MNTPAGIGQDWAGAARRALAATGAGLLVWLSISSVLLAGRTGPLQSLATLQMIGVGLALVLMVLAIPDLLPRATPARWRPHARLAWGVAVAAALVLLALQLRPLPDPAWTTVSAAVACMAALGTITALAASEGVAAPLHVPTALASSLLAGASLLFAVIALSWKDAEMATLPSPSLLLLGGVAAALLMAGWQSDGGLMPWALRRGRWLALGLLVLLPAVLAVALYAAPGLATLAWPLAAASVLAGLVVQRRLPGCG